MASLLNIWLSKDVLETLAQTVAKKGDKGVSIDVSINDETNQFDQNVSAYVSQTKEQREQKVKRFYVGNGKVFWTDGKITKAVKKDGVPEERPSQEVDDLPF
jgi:LDH2 family malate/lactate/ureidoglycolate dehydrogenase